MTSPNECEAKEPIISIVMPTYNRPSELHVAVSSVLSQTYTNWKLYIIGDHCPILNEFMELMKLFISENILEEKITWINLPENHGSGGAFPRNYALTEIVDTTWWCYLDDDNEWLPNHLQNVVDLIQNPKNKDVVYMFCNFIVEGKEILCTIPKQGRLDTSSVCHRTSLLKEYGMWKERVEVGYYHDWELFSRWGDEAFLATNKATLIYNTDHNHQTYESIVALGE